MKNFVVTFRWDEDTFCTNICIAESEEKARECYEREYHDVDVRPVYDEWEVESAKRKGMPFVTA